MSHPAGVPVAGTPAGWRTGRPDRSGRPDLLLVAHGSRDTRAAHATSALCRAVRRAWPGGDVTPAYLDFTAPLLPDALLAWAVRDDWAARDDWAVRDAWAGAVRGRVVVPLLLTAGYHARIDIPGELDRPGAPAGVRLARVLGPTGPDDTTSIRLLVAALRHRLIEANSGSSVARAALDSLAAGGAALDSLAAEAVGADGVVLAAAGTRDPAARAGVDLVAAALGAALGLPCRPGYATGAPSSPSVGGAPTPRVADGVVGPGMGPSARVAGVGDVVSALRAEGAGRVAVAGFFLAPGLLYDRAVRQARAAGAYRVAAPLRDAPDLVELVCRRSSALATFAQV